MRRKKLEALIEQKIKRTGLNPRPHTQYDTAASILDVEAGVRRGVEHEFRIGGRLWYLHQEIARLDERIEETYRNGGDRRADPNRADRNPK